MQASEWSGELPQRLRVALPDLSFRFLTYLNQNFIEAEAADVAAILRHLQLEEGFDMLTDLTALDRAADEKRFEIVYVLYSFPRNERIRLKIRTGIEEPVPSATGVFAAANWLEREVYDMFGVSFSGHPNLKRILMPDEWQGFPLRKDKSIIEMDGEWVRQNLGIESAQS